MTDTASDKPPCPRCGGTGLVQSYVQWHGPGRPPADSCKPVTTRCPDCPGPDAAHTPTSYPFPGADAHPYKRGGELCVEGTRIPVARVLVELTELVQLTDESSPLGRLDKPKCLHEIALDFDIDYEALAKCLRGLADWLKTQKWYDQ